MDEPTVWRLRVRGAEKMVTKPEPYIAASYDEAVWFANTHGGGIEGYELDEIPKSQWEAEAAARARRRNY